MENENNEVLDLELNLTEEVLKAIEVKAEKLKKSKKLIKVLPLAVEGDEFDEKDLYVAYMKEPSFKDFSKFQTMGKTNEAQALRTLARDCFLDGDKELLDDDSLFMFGLMPQVMNIIRFRKSKIVNLSRAGK